MGIVYSRAKRKLVQGIGVNDADYAIHHTINGKRIECPFYRCWMSMLSRCTEKLQSRLPTYAGCKVCDEWRSFMAFRSWMQQQEWEGRELDKDMIGNGKLYSPENCVFVPSVLNRLFIDAGTARGEFPIGVSWDKKSAKFRAFISVDSKYKHLGLFTSADKAHYAWLKAKLDIAQTYLDDEQNPRVRYAIQCGIAKLQSKYGHVLSS